MNWSDVISLICNISSLLLLLYSTYNKIVEDCKLNPHDLNEIQRYDAIKEKLINIERVVISRRNSNADTS